MLEYRFFISVGGPDAKRKKTSRRATCAPAQFASSTTTPLFYRAGSALDYARQMLQVVTGECCGCPLVLLLKGNIE